MHRKQTPYTEKKLLATRNALYLKGASNNVVNITKTAAWNFGGGNFIISIVGQFGVDGFLMQSGAGGAADLSILFSGMSFRSDQLNSYVLSPSALKLRLNRLYRISIVRRGTTLEMWLNNSLEVVRTVGTDTFNLNNTQPRIRIGDRSDATGVAPFTGFASNLLVAKYAPTANEIEDFHNTNIPPKSWHQYIEAHYPLNHNLGLKAYDVVEQYNYAKVTPIVANHGDLINYTNDEAGVTNPLIQTAWQNIYSKKKDGLNLTSRLGTTVYGEILSIANRAFTADFIIYGQCASKGFTDFLLYFGDLSVTNRIQVNTDSNLTGALTMTNGSGSYNSVAFDAPKDSVTNFVICHRQVGTTSYTRAYSVVNGVPSVTFIRNGSQTRTFVPYNVARWLFFSPTVIGFPFNGIPAGIVGYIENPYAIENLDFTVPTSINRMVNTLLLAGKSDDYKKYAAQSLFTIDFGDIFLDTGNYFARDNSGNARHARLYNWTLATDQPLRIEQHTGQPEIVRGFKMSENIHFASVAGYTLPSSLSKGYTVTMAVSCNANDFGNGQNVGFGNDIQQADWMMWFSTGAFVNFHGFGGLRKGATVSPFNLIFTQDGGTPATSVSALESSLNVDRPIELAWVLDVPKLRLKFYVDGVLKSDIAMTSFSTLFELTSTLRINQSDYGKEAGAKTFIRANIYNTVLTQAELIDSYSHGFVNNKVTRELKTSYIFTDESFYIDGSDVKIRNTAPDGNQAHNMTISGLVGATAADKLNDLKTNFLFNVDTLR